MAKNALDYETRPWGHFEVLSEFKTNKDGDIVIKKLEVLPGKRLSYQSHALRQEHWLVIQGKGAVIINDERLEVSVGSAVDVPLGAKHRIINEDESETLIFIEVSSGTFDEHDNTRYEDDFGRV
jgi:mannose-6-phosphate isomerase-like protein (cupin superfamily)